MASRPRISRPSSSSAAAAALRCRRRCPTCAACSSASTTRSRSCPRGRCARASPTSASATSRPTRFDFTTDDRRTSRSSALRQPLAPREEGSGRGALRAEAADRLLDRPQRPGEVPRRRSATACSSGTRRSSASASRTRSRSRSSPTTPTSTPRDVAPRVDPLDDRRRAASFGAHRPVGGRSAHRRDPRRRHRHRRDQLRARPLAWRAEQHSERAGRSRQRRLARRRRTVPYADDVAEQRSGVRDVAPRGARRDRRRTARSRGVRRSRRSRTSIMHEVGHTLGLHAQLPRVDDLHARRSSPTASSRSSNGIAGSVMEYNAVQHRAAQGERRASTTMSTLGPYDYWAIEYALPRARARAEEAAELAKIAAQQRARSSPSRPTRTQLPRRLDPAGQPRATSAATRSPTRERRFTLARELWERTESARAEGRARPTRCCAATSRAACPRSRRARMLGGASTSAASRCCATAPAAGRAPLTPVAGRQAARGAEAHRRRSVFSADSFRF